MKTKHTRLLARVTLLIFAITFIVLLFGSCSTLKVTEKENNTEVKTVVSEKSKTQSTNTEVIKIKFPSISDRSEFPVFIPTKSKTVYDTITNTITKYVPTKLPNLDFVKNYGDVKVKFGIKEGVFYHDYFSPERIETNTSKNSSTTSNSSYVSITDRYILKFTKIVKNTPNWKIYFLVFVLLVVIFRKTIVKSLTKLLPTAKWVIWLASKII